MNIHTIAKFRKAVAAAIAFFGVVIAAAPASALGIKTVGAVVYAQAPTPTYYAAAPSAYGQAPYYLVTNHHKKYIVPAAAFAPQAYAPQAYAPVAAAPATYAYTATAAAPVAAVTPTTVGNAPEDGDSETTTTPEFKLTGALYQTFKDELRKFYQTNTETEGMARVKALKDHAKELYTTYYEDTGDIAANSPLDRKLDEIVEEVVGRERDRNLYPNGKPTWVWTGYGYQLVRVSKTDGYHGSYTVQGAAPSTVQYLQAPQQQQLYYAPAHIYRVR